MDIKKLLKNVKVSDVMVGSIEDIDVKAIASDSRCVGKGSVFVAVRGVGQDGHKYISDAINRGATAIVSEDKNAVVSQETDIPFILVKDSKDALLRMADVFYGYPYRNIQFLGITGTNGKTTCSYLIRSILTEAGKNCALIGTIGYKIKDVNIPSGNTTPGILELHELAKQMIKARNEYVAMEVSSHAIHQDRVAGIVFRAAVFTNLTQDHLDYHKDMEEYFAVKQRLFIDYVDKDSSLIINIDDSFGRRLYNDLKGKKISYGFKDCDVCVTENSMEKSGSTAVIKTPSGNVSVKTNLVGRHNLYNILAAVAFGISQGLGIDVISRGVEALSFVPGRLERIDSKKGVSIFVDYAHTDDALKNVLESLRSIIHNGRIITVFGCGGDRDRSKRPKMGAVAAALSDHCIITSDNPRSEDPETIIAQVVSGIVSDNFEIEPDRRNAIHLALNMAKDNDFVLVAGKGHETYQIVKNEIFHFDDKDVILKYLKDTGRYV